jgi:hypothetical protein
MQKPVILALPAALPAVAPVWNYNNSWSFGPFCGVLFLLGTNLMGYFAEHPALGNAEPR